MKQFSRTVCRFVQDGLCGDLVEYALVAALVGLGAVVGTHALGSHITTALTRLVRELSNVL